MIPPTSGRAFLQEYADRNGLKWIGNLGELEQFIDSKLYDAAEVNRRSNVVEHVACFQALGATPERQPAAVLAIAFAYVDDSPELHEQAEAFADRFGLSVRMGHPDDRIYNANKHTPSRSGVRTSTTWTRS